MNKKFQVCVGALLLLPLFAEAASTVTLPLTLPTGTGGSSTAKLSSAAPALAATSAAVTSLPQLPAAASAASAASTSGGSQGGGSIPLPGLEGLGGGGSLPLPPLGTGIRPIRLPGPLPYATGN